MVNKDKDYQKLQAYIV